MFSRGQSVHELFATSEAIQLAAINCGRILTFMGDVSRTSNALRSIQVDFTELHIFT